MPYDGFPPINFEGKFQEWKTPLTFWISGVFCGCGGRI